MIITLEEHKTLLKKLVEAGVEFILVGGYAVNFHGYSRTTGDMDIWLRPDNTNRDMMMKLLLDEGFEEEMVQAISKVDFTKGIVFHFGEPPKRVDFLTHISNVKFDEAWEAKQLLPVENIGVPVLHLNHLILSKISNSRTKDKADVEELQRINKNKKGL